MYEMLKKLQPVAEKIGAIEEISVYTEDKIMGNRISINGTDKDGRAFELKLVIKDSDADA